MNISNITIDLLTIMEHIDDAQRFDIEFERVIWTGFRNFLNQLHLMRKYQTLFYKEKDRNLSTDYLKKMQGYEKKVDEILDDLIRQSEEFKR